MQAGKILRINGIKITMCLGEGNISITSIVKKSNVSPSCVANFLNFLNKEKFMKKELHGRKAVLNLTVDGWALYHEIENIYKRICKDE